VIYGVALYTLDRAAGNGATMIIVTADDPIAAELKARRLAETRFDCVVVAEHAIPCPEFEPHA
jgi:hypothetical protein